MFNRLLILFAILAIFSVSVVSGCPKDEVWDECGTACPPTCKNPDPKLCTMQCVIGCRCEKGLVRNDKGDCVPKSRC